MTSLVRLAERDRFRLDVDLKPHEVIDRFVRHARVRPSDQPYPYPPPPHGRPFLIFNVTRKGFCLRHYAGPLDVASPVANVTVKSRPWGSRIKVRFSRVGGRRPLNLSPASVLGGLIMIGVVGIVAGMLGKVITTLFGVVWLGTLGLFFSMTYPRNGMRVYGAPLRGLLGDVLARHAIAPAEERDPYRLLPAPALAHTPRASSPYDAGPEEWPSG